MVIISMIAPEELNIAKQALQFQKNCFADFHNFQNHFTIYDLQSTNSDCALPPEIFLFPTISVRVQSEGESSGIQSTYFILYIIIAL